MAVEVTDPRACLGSGLLSDLEGYTLGVRKPGFPATGLHWALAFPLSLRFPQSEPSSVLGLGC